MSKITKKIIAIGGGDINSGSTFLIDQEIVRLSTKKRPQFLFIPTASSDNKEYCALARKYFESTFNCIVDDLLLFDNPVDLHEIAKKIARADIIYVGGGNTLKMMRLWRKLGVDKLLKKAYDCGTIMSGISAGAICWFDFGHSDSMSFYSPNSWQYIKVRGLGLISGILCPHYDSATRGIPRKKSFDQMLQKRGGSGLALDDNCAVVLINGKITGTISSKKGALAYKVYKQNRVMISQKVDIKRTK